MNSVALCSLSDDTRILPTGVFRVTADYFTFNLEHYIFAYISNVITTFRFLLNDCVIKLRKQLNYLKFNTTLFASNTSSMSVYIEEYLQKWHKIYCCCVRNILYEG